MKKADNITTLKKFLSNESFKKYSNGIEKIEGDFIASGYERFLWKPTLAEFECMRITLEKVAKHKHIVNERITSFMEQFKHDGIVFMFPERYDSVFFIIQEVCKAANVRIINNIYPDDETVNYIAVFDKSDVENIVLMNHLAYSGYMSDVFGGYKLYGNSLGYYAEFCADNGEQYMA